MKGVPIMASYIILPTREEDILPRIKITVELGYDDRGKRLRRHKTVALNSLSERVIKKAITVFEVEVANDKPKDYNNLTYPQAVTLWWDNHANKLAIKSRKTYKKAIQSSLDHFGDMRINKMSKVHFVEYKSYLIDNEVGDRKGKFDACKNVLAKLVEWDLLRVNPALKIAFPRVKRKMDFYNETEINQLFDILKTINIKHAMVIKLAVLSGMRHAEISGLSIENIDFKNNVIHVKQNLNFEKGVGFSIGPTKNKKERTLQMPVLFMQELKTYVNGVKKNRFRFGDQWRGLEGMNLVFANEDGYPHEESLFPRVFKNLVRKSGLKEIRFHDLRHTHSSFLLSKGANMKVIQERLGHSSITITMDTYSHLTKGDEQTAAALLNDILL